MDEAVGLSKAVGEEIAGQYGLPVFLYGQSASAAHRENLSHVRKGEFEGLGAKLLLPEWAPDYGPSQKHPTAGAVAIGARNPLVAYNVNLGTNNLAIADSIAKKVRHIGGGLRYCKAMGVALDERGIVQVSMNLTDYTHTSIYQAFELVKMEACRYGVAVTGSEVIGLLPLEALAGSLAYYLRLENFSVRQVLEYQLMNS